MKKIIVSILLLSSTKAIFFQAGKEAQQVSMNIEGQVAVTTNGEAVFFNMGGPALKFSFSKIAFAINMMPSLRFEEDEPKPIVTPILGVWPQVYFLKDKRFILSFPCYYYTTRNIWTATVGLGYV